MRGGYKAGEAAGPSSRGGRGGPKKPPLTHFLCLPLVTASTQPQLEASLHKFRELVQSTNEESEESTQIPAKAIRPLGTIHFTLGVMSLTSVDRVSEAIGFLQTFDLEGMLKDILDEGEPSSEDVPAFPPRMSLTSLHSMHPPKKTSILYAGPDDSSGIFVPFCGKLRDTFSAAGFLVPDDRPLKLHATIVNTVYAKAGDRGKAGTGSAGLNGPQASAQGSGLPAESYSTQDAPPETSRGHGRTSKAPMRLDATGLLDKCKDFVWAENFTIEKIAICKMGAKKILDDGGNLLDEQYEEVATVSLTR